MAAVLQGGSTIGALTLTRWYSAHVIFLPALLVGLVVAHLVLMRLQGSSGPVAARQGKPLRVLSVPGVPRHGRRVDRAAGGLRDGVERHAAARGSRRSDRRQLHPAARVVFPRSLSAAEVFSRQVGSRRRDRHPRRRRGVPGAAAVDRSRPRARPAPAPARDDARRGRLRGRRRPDDARLARPADLGARAMRGRCARSADGRSPATAAAPSATPRRASPIRSSRWRCRAGRSGWQDTSAIRR